MSSLQKRLTQTQHELAKTQKAPETLQAEFMEYAYVVSHDFKVPFRQMQGFADLLLEHKAQQLDEDATTYVQFISKSATKCQDLIATIRATVLAWP